MVDGRCGWVVRKEWMGGGRSVLGSGPEGLQRDLVPMRLYSSGLRGCGCLDGKGEVGK